MVEIGGILIALVVSFLLGARWERQHAVGFLRGFVKRHAERGCPKGPLCEATIIHQVIASALEQRLHHRGGEKWEK
jgi:hypothetical protein